MAGPTYIPGLCNIGTAEIRSKKLLGLLSLSIAALYFIACIQIPINPFLRLFIFFPITLSVLGFLQGYFRFCVTFGLQGVYNMATIFKKPEKVPEYEFCVQDRGRAGVLLFFSILFGAISAALVAFI